MNKRIKLLAVLAFTLAVSTFLNAVEVDSEEVQSGSMGATIDFINYNGPYDTINTAEQIRGIGSALSSAVLGTSAGDPSRYYIIHAVDPSVTTGFDADILVLGPQASVDHIDNIRRILSAYLMAAYKYSQKDAQTLAVFITVYNAVYRGKMDVFTKRYKDVVIKNISAPKVGLSLLYSDWPGNTQIVIPLSDPRLTGTISTIDTSSLTEKEVVSKLKEDPGAAIDTRKDMVDLKEREAEDAQKRAETAQKEAVIAKNETAEKTAEAKIAEKEAVIAKEEATKAASEAAQKPDDAQAQVKAAEAQKTAEEKAAIAAEKKEDAVAVEKISEEKVQTAAADQKLADTKEKEVQTERKEIAADIQTVVDSEKAAAQANAASALEQAIPGYALRVIDPSTFLSELVLLDLSTGSVMKTSALNSIRNRTFFSIGTELLAIAGKKAANASVRLVLINDKDLEITKQGVDIIAEQSMLVQNANDIYAVLENSNGSFVLGRFDKTLEVKAKSAIEVLPYTAITVTEKGILVQSANGELRLLRSTDLVDQTNN